MAKRRLRESILELEVAVDSWIYWLLASWYAIAWSA